MSPKVTSPQELLCQHIGLQSVRLCSTPASRPCRHPHSAAGLGSAVRPARRGAGGGALPTPPLRARARRTRRAVEKKRRNWIFEPTICLTVYLEIYSGYRSRPLATLGDAGADALAAFSSSLVAPPPMARACTTYAERPSESQRVVQAHCC